MDIANVFRDKLAFVPGDTTAKLTPEQKPIKQRATVIISRIKGPLQEAARSEAQLAQKGDAGADEDARHVLWILQNCLKADAGSAHSLIAGHEDHEDEDTVEPTSVNGLTNIHVDHDADGDIDMADADGRVSDGPNHISGPSVHEVVLQSKGIKLQLIARDTVPVSVEDTDGSIPALSNSGSTNPSNLHADPLTPPRSEKDPLAPLAQGGVAWYLEGFNPMGTTIHDEKWQGREVLRELSEELSELDEDAMNGLIDTDVQVDAGIGVKSGDTLQPNSAQKRKAPARRKRLR